MTDQPKPKRDAPAAYDDDVVDLDALIRDYGSDGAPLRRAERPDDYDAPPKPKRKNDAKSSRDLRAQLADFLRTPYGSSYALEHVVTNNSDRLYAAIAHLMLLLGIPLSFASAGALLPVAIIAPLLIYLANRQRAPFVAQHALQAMLALAASTLGWLALTIGSAALSIMLTVILTMTIVGVAFVPFLWLGRGAFVARASGSAIRRVLLRMRWHGAGAARQDFPLSLHRQADALAPRFPFRLRFARLQVHPAREREQEIRETVEVG